MPNYEALCPHCGYHVHEFRNIKELGKGFWCPDCNRDMDIVIQAPLLVRAAPEVHYTSPIDDRPITSMAARREDLAKHGCQPYDPEMKTDYHRRIADAESALDQSVDASVEEAVSKMDGRTRGKLASELIDHGTTAEVIRRTG